MFLVHVKGFMLGAAATPEGFHLTLIPLQIMKITLVITQPDHSRQLRNILQSTHGLHNHTNSIQQARVVEPIMA